MMRKKLMHKSPAAAMIFIFVGINAGFADEGKALTFNSCIAVALKQSPLIGGMHVYH
jgi:hypothetical protein